MIVLEKIGVKTFPLDWVDLDFYPNSVGKKREIYLYENKVSVCNLIELFYSLFDDIKDEIFVFDSSWWKYCLDSWNTNTNKFNFDINNKSLESKKYLSLLNESEIEIHYSGSCKCHDWSKFLDVSLRCLIDKIAPYSHIFYCKKYDFFFYFHHTFSIGFYYKSENIAIKKIIQRANLRYNLK